ncbi:DUF4331 domain-containing protein [Amycolatopsis sp. H20-H5]|uniref:DUF4331 domain-containing protein n=1 Tax=Amycolatopsis sp. H20-H5 TaxID=3046309 RepID=UPI003FA3DB06
MYAFVSPDKPDTVTLIANFVPLEDPDGGPNFFEFGDDVLYEIHVSNSGNATADISYQFRFHTEIRNEKTFLYNTGPITALNSPNWNRRQFYSMTKVDRNGTRVRGGVKNAPCPPCNIGPASTPNYAALAASAVTTTELGGKVFAGQRAEGFYVDLGAIFDLGDLRPFQQLNVLNKMPAAPGVNSTANKNIHSIVLQVPKSHLSPKYTDPKDPQSTIGVWATASRQQTRVYNVPKPGEVLNIGPYVQVSRLGNPLVNEVLIPLGKKDLFNSAQPHNDKQFVDEVAHPELATLLPVLYPGVFPNLDKLNKSGKPRADLEAVLLTGIPAGIIPGFQNYTGATQADMLRLNMAIPPSASPSNLGLVGGDAAGYPNGRRVFDDVTTIELRAIAGAIYPLIDKTYTPDAAAGAITPGLTSSNTDLTAKNTVHYLPSFPYLGTPHSGYDAR